MDNIEKQKEIKITKSMRYEIIKPVNSSWEDFGKILNDLRYKSARIGNYMVQLLWQWDNYRNEYKAQNGKYPDNKEQPNYYKLLREKFPDVGVDIINQTRQWVANRYQKDRKEIFLLKKSILSFKDNMPICIYNQAYKIIKNDNNFTINIRLLPSSTEQSRFESIIKFGEKSKKSILEKIINGEYKQGMMQIVKDKHNKKWYIIISYTFTPKTKEYKNKDRTLHVVFSEDKKGIELKISNSKFEQEIDCSHIEHTINQFNNRLEKLKKQQIKGISKNIQNIRSNLQDKQNNFKSTVNHRLSKIIVERAIKYKCNEIFVECDKWFIDWTLCDLKSKIKYKSEENNLNYI